MKSIPLKVIKVEKDKEECKQLKKWNRAWKINLIEDGNPHWADIAPGLGL